jgi:hypothetical protein
MPKRIPLSRNLFTLIDDEFVYLAKYNWFASDTNYAVRTDNKNSCRFALHREILNLTDPNLQVDHINGNTLDNRKINLRACTANENSKNKTKPFENKVSEYKGVCRYRNKWRSQINVNGEKIYLGLFYTEELASEAYKIASEKYHKEFGYHEGKVLNTVNFDDYEIVYPEPVIIKYKTYTVRISDGRLFDSIEDAAKQLNVKKNTIVKACCSNGLRRVRGFNIKYETSYYAERTMTYK